MNDNYKIKELKQKLDFVEVVVDFVKIFASEHIGGQVEVDNENLSRYMLSGKFLVRFQVGNLDKDSIYRELENDVLNGFPIWELLKLPKWTMNMMNGNFIKEEAVRIENLQKEYCCFSCKYFVNKSTEFGEVQKCNYNDSKRLFSSRETFELKKKCKNYSANI